MQSWLGAKANCFSFGWIKNWTIVKKPAVKRRTTQLEIAKTARDRCRGREEKIDLCADD